MIEKIRKIRDRVKNIMSRTKHYLKTKQPMIIIITMPAFFLVMSLLVKWCWRIYNNGGW